MAPAMAPRPLSVVALPPNHSTLQWHPTMASSNGTLVPRPIRQSGSSPSPPIGSKNPYSYRYLGNNHTKPTTKSYLRNIRSPWLWTWYVSFGEGRAQHIRKLLNIAMEKVDHWPRKLRFIQLYMVKMKEISKPLYFTIYIRYHLLTKNTSKSQIWDANLSKHIHLRLESKLGIQKSGARWVSSGWIRR